MARVGLAWEVNILIDIRTTNTHHQSTLSDRIYGHNQAGTALLNHVNVIVGHCGGCLVTIAILLRHPIVFHLSIELLLGLLRSAILGDSLAAASTSPVPPLSSRTRSSAVSSAGQRTARSPVLAWHIAINVAGRRPADVGMTDRRDGSRPRARGERDAVSQGARANCRIEWVPACC